MTATEQVILVDEQDKEIGTAEKLQAHLAGLRHRAFSIFIFRERPKFELLLQQRADNKYHSPGLWTNTCCSHPRPGEDILAAANRRLQEEMGLSVPLQSLGWFHYIAHFDNGLTENEVDHVFIGTTDIQQIALNPQEAQAYRWVDLADLTQEMDQHPERFTPWLKLALDLVKRRYLP
jgi:isopentenyl-diphosphate delta-isomerase type 1